MAEQKKPDDMDEDELARFFEAHKGDVSLWERKPAKIRVRRGGPSTVFAVRMTPEELEELRLAANAEGRTISDLVREAALKEARRKRKTVASA